MAMLRWLSLTVWFACPLFAQQPPPPSSTPSPVLIPRSQAEREREVQIERHIILNVLVTDASGKPVRGLNQQDFALLDNHQPQKIATLKAVEGSAPNSHVHVVLMLDALDNSSQQLRKEFKEVAKFLGQDQGRLAYPVSIAMLTDFGAKVGNSSSDGNALMSELKQLPMTGSAPMKNQSAPPLNWNGDAIANAARSNEELNRQNQHFLLAVPFLANLAREQENVPGRVLLIWIGPGWPLLDGPEFRADSLQAQSSFLTYIVDVTNALRVSQMTLDEVSPSSENDNYRAYLNGVQTRSDAKAGNLALPVFAYQTGGRVMDQSRDLASEIATCIADAESYYVLSFDSSPAKGPDEYHSLQVNVNPPGMTVRTSKAYYAQQ